MPDKVTCPYCSQSATCEDSAVIYGRSYGWVWICRCKPAMSYVGCHGNTKVPLGTLADHPTREARKRTHRKFDPSWQRWGMTRKEAYAWLAESLNMTADECHIAKFTIHACIQAIEACKARNAAKANR